MKRSKNRLGKKKGERLRLDKKRSKRPNSPASLAPKYQQSAVDALVQTEPNLAPPADNLLERARTQWQFGDWDSLSRITSDILPQHPDRAHLALLAAAAHFHYNDASAVRHFIRLAREWGCSNTLISRILLAGVHNTLGRAALLRGEERRAITHFEGAIATGNPGCETRLLAKARLSHQRDLIDLGVSPVSPKRLPAPGIHPDLLSTCPYDDPHS